MIIQKILDDLTGAAPAEINLVTLLVLILAIELTRIIFYIYGIWGGAMVRNGNRSLLQRNIVANVLNGPAAIGIPMSPGEAINRLDDDVADFADFPTWVPELTGHFIYTTIAFVIMFRINWQITAVAAIPLLLGIFINRFAWNRFLRYITESRDASSAVTGFLGEILAAVQVVKIADAQAGTIGYFESLNKVRRQANVRFHTFFAVFRTAADNAGDIAIALMVLLAGQAISEGSFTIGQFALFTSYLFFAARFPADMGSYMSEWLQQRVSIKRMQSIQPGASPVSLVAHHPIFEAGNVPPISRVEKTARDQLSQLKIRGLSYMHPTASGAIQSGNFEASDPYGSGASGIFDIDLTLERGSFTVITGRVGSGKSTFLRVLLGLLPQDSGGDLVEWAARG